MKYKDEFAISEKISNLSFDFYENKLYIAQWSMNKITIFDEAKKNDSLEIDSPMYMEFTKDAIFVVSKTDYS